MGQQETDSYLFISKMFLFYIYFNTSCTFMKTTSISDLLV